MLRIAFMLSVLLLAASGCSAPHVAAERYEYSRLAMGVEARIVLHAPDRTSAEAAVDEAFGAIATLEDALSDWRESSELSRALRVAGERPVPVSGDLGTVIQRSLELARATDGAFDPTLGPVVALWREARRSGRLPDEVQLAAARALTGVEGVLFDPSQRTLRLARPGLRLDFGAIGKGYACQRAVEVLQRRGIESALVEMGGDIVCSGPPPGRQGWEIDLAPNAAESSGERLLVAHAAVSTSGDRAQAVEIGGRRYSHVVDPRTGVGLVTHARAVVVASDGATADALATAVTVRGGEAGLELARRLGADVRLDEEHAGRPRRLATPGFARFVGKFPSHP